MNPETSNSETGQSATASPERQQHHHRRHRHRPRPFYDRWITPYKRELKTGALFCAMVLLAYLLWSSLVK
jgi:hypothetical protein